MGRLENKVAVITGAASGMGRGTAVRFAAEGAAVVIADLNEEGGAAVVRECRENGGNAVFQRPTSPAKPTSAQRSLARSRNSANSMSSITMRV
jgi:NAD(P)-dependent dehydrogenase (short-subunit alcohol dehydrogenase family)